MRILVKGSGDLVLESAFPDLVAELARPGDNFVVALVGGGSQISAVLAKHEIKSEFTVVGRVIHDKDLAGRGRELARRALEENRIELERALQERHAYRSRVITPVVCVGGMLCHLNADLYACALSVNFDRTIILTKRGRDKKDLRGHNLEVMEI